MNFNLIITFFTAISCIINCLFSFPVKQEYGCLKEKGEKFYRFINGRTAIYCESMYRLYQEKLDDLIVDNLSSVSGMEYLKKLGFISGMETLAASFDDGVFAKVAYSSENNLLVYVEDTQNSANSLLVINGIEFILEGSSYSASDIIYIGSRDGAKELVYENLKISDVQGDLGAVERESSRGNWVPATSGYINGGQKSGWLEVLELLYTLYNGYMVVGRISLTGVSALVNYFVGTGITVGSVIWATVYYRCRQWYMSDCPTYIKQEDLYYSDPAYNSYIGTATYTFHTVNPYSYTGACLAYA